MGGICGEVAVPPPPFDLTQHRWEEYAELLRTVGMWGFPRAFGTPDQVAVVSPAAFFQSFEKAYWRTVPIFISHNRYEEGATWSHGLRGDIIFEWGFGDFDTGNGSGLSPDEVHEEVQRTESWATEQDLTHVWIYSGSDGGFHLRIKFEEGRHPRRYLEQWEPAFWRGLKNHLSLRSINIQCANPVHLERMPMTRYVHRKAATDGYKAEPNWCVPVPYQWIRDSRWDDVRELSREPVLYPADEIRYQSSSAPPTLEAFTRKMGWETFAHEIGVFHPTLGDEPKGKMADLMREYIPDRKCLQTLIFGPNPRHYVRLGWIHEIIAVGMYSGMPFSIEELQNLTTLVAEEAKWEDRHNVNERAYQVASAYRRPYCVDEKTGEIRPHGMSCEWLRENGVCIGKSCPVFKIAFPVEWEEYLREHPEAIPVPVNPDTEAM